MLLSFRTAAILQLYSRKNIVSSTFFWLLHSAYAILGLRSLTNMKYLAIALLAFSACSGPQYRYVAHCVVPGFGPIDLHPVTAYHDRGMWIMQDTNGVEAFFSDHNCMVERSSD